MKFTKRSNNLMKNFINNFDKLCIKKNANTQKQIDKILTIFYKDIKSCDLYVNTIYKRKLIQGTITEINNLSDLPKTHLLTSEFVPSDVKMQIKHKSIGYYKVTTYILELRITIYFLIFDR